MRLKCAALTVAVIVWSGHAVADYFTYSDWAELPKAARAYYMTGVFDALTGVVNSPRDKYQRHYAECIASQHMGNIELSDNLFAYGSTRPEIQRRGVVGALISYLLALCGEVPAN